MYKAKFQSLNLPFKSSCLGADLPFWFHLPHWSQVNLLLQPRRHLAVPQHDLLFHTSRSWFRLFHLLGVAVWADLCSGCPSTLGFRWHLLGKSALMLNDLFLFSAFILFSFATHHIPPWGLGSGACVSVFFFTYRIMNSLRHKSFSEGMIGCFLSHNMGGWICIGGVFFSYGDINELLLSFWSSEVMTLQGAATIQCYNPECIFS